MSRFWSKNTAGYSSIAVLSLALAAPVVAQQDQGPPPDAPGYGQQSNAPLMSPQQLDGLVAPIALYADPLIAQVLAASTYPTEVVEADRWLQSSRGLSGPALTDAARDQNWDPSVQALVVFPSVLQMMDKNLRWTTDLGNAFLAQEQDVMDAVQRQRRAAQQSGRLVSNEQQRVDYGPDNYVTIEPTQPEYIYVPVYDPIAIWGPGYYNPYGPFWYPPRPAYGVYGGGGGFSFFIGIPIARSFHSWGGWNNYGWNPGWRNRTVIVNNNFYVRNNYHAPNVVVRNGYNNNWAHDPVHRQGVPYRNGVRGDFSRAGRPVSSPPARDMRPGVGAPSREFRQDNPRTDRIPERNGAANPAVRDRGEIDRAREADRVRHERSVNQQQGQPAQQQRTVQQQTQPVQRESRPVQQQRQEARPVQPQRQEARPAQPQRQEQRQEHRQEHKEERRSEPRRSEKDK